MVGSGNGEVLGHELSNFRYDLEIDSEDDVAAGDTVNLINTSISDARRKPKIKQDDSLDENVWSISIQMFIPFLLAGFGMVAASLLLDVVQVLNLLN